MRLRALMFTLGLALASLHASAALSQTLYLDEQFGFTLTTGVVYASHPVGAPPTNQDLRLELYQPSGVGVPALRPAIVAIHGGSFTGGSRFSGTQIGTCERMARRGYTCVSIDYRLAGDDPVVGPAYQTLESFVAVSDPVLAPAIASACEDTVAALQWLLDNAGALGVDPGRVSLAGYSAGGVLTQFVGYVLDQAGVVIPVAPRATFNLAGSVDTLIQTVDPGEAALLMVHGDADTTVPISGAYALEAQALAAGIPYELDVLTGQGHGINIFSDEVAPGETIFERFVSFNYTYAIEAAALPLLPGAGLLALALALGSIGAFRLPSR